MSRRLRERTTFSIKQLEMFEQLYRVTHYPDVIQRKQLAAKVNLAESKIQVSNWSTCLHNYDNTSYILQQNHIRYSVLLGAEETSP